MRKLLLITLTAFSLSAQADLVAVDHAHNWNNFHSGKASGPKLSGTCKSAISVASAENKKAKKVGFEWRDTGKFIKQAKKSGGKKCVKLANKAKGQAILAQKQARAQANAGPVGF